MIQAIKPAQYILSEENVKKTLFSPIRKTSVSQNFKTVKRRRKATIVLVVLYLF